MIEELQNQIELLKREIEEIHIILFKKSGAGSADIRTKIRAGSSIAIGTGEINSAGMFGAGVVDQAAIGANACGQSELKDESVDITVLTGQTTGTGTCTSGSTIMGYYQKTNQDQFIKSIGISGTTITITLLAAATANNVFTVNLIKT